MQFLDGFDDHGVVHFVNLDALSDGFEERDGELAAEMLAEFFETAQDDERVRGIDVEQLVCEAVEAEVFDEAQNAFGARGVEQALAARIDSVERNAHRNGFAMANLVIGDLLELVGGPMAEV